MHRMSIVAVLLLCVVPAAWVLAEEPAGKDPTVQELIAGIRVLSPDTKGIEWFRVKAQFNVGPGDSIATVRVHWEKGQPPGVYVSTGKRGMPVWFAADDQLMMFDVAERQIKMYDNHPSVEIGLQGTRINTGFGLRKVSDKPQLRVDPASFLKKMGEAQSLARDEEDNWRFIAKSGTGLSTWQATFHRDPPHRLLELTGRSTANDDLRMRIYDIQVNDTTREPWPHMPPVEAFPSELKIVRPYEAEEKPSIQAALQWIQDTTRVLLDHLALDYPADRGLFHQRTDEQWKAMETLEHDLGPHLGHLIGFRDLPRK